MAWLFLALLLSGYYLLFWRVPLAGTGRYRVTPAEGFAGRDRDLELEVEFFLPIPAFWRIEAFALGRAGVQPRTMAGFGWGRVRLRLRSRARPLRRGEYRLPDPVLSIEDVLGVFRRQSTIDTNAASIVVFPRRWPVLSPALRLTLLGEGPEVRGVGLEDPTRYRGARPYRPGDPLRRIHWKLTARAAEPMVREYAFVRATGVWLFIDTAGAQGVFVDHAAELAASLAVVLMADGMAVGLAWPGGSLPPAPGAEGARRLLRALARLTPSRRVEEPPLPPPGVNLLILTQHAPPEVIEGALRARAQAAGVTLLLFPEGFFLRPGERGRPVWGRPPSVERLWAKRKLLLAAGVRVAIVRGKEPLHFL